jgi:hypothetical protein
VLHKYITVVVPYKTVSSQLADGGVALVDWFQTELQHFFVLAVVTKDFCLLECNSMYSAKPFPLF